jgi:hypothetical protein
MAIFQAGQPKTGGRTRGVKNRLSYAFITALVEDFEKHGAEAIRICRVEKPNEYLRVIAHLMPKELTVEVEPLQEISDDQLIEYIEHTQRQLASRIERIESRAGETADGESSRVLQTLCRSEKVS